MELTEALGNFALVTGVAAAIAAPALILTWAAASRWSSELTALGQRMCEIWWRLGQWWRR